MNPFSWQRAAVILNRGSGAVSSVGAEALAEELGAIFATAGGETTVRLVPGDRVREAVEEAAKGDAEVIIVGGGDGTVATAATALAGQAKPLGILPLGTFNLAARDVGMPLDWRQAAMTLKQAAVAEIDLLKLGDKLHCCMLVLGFYPTLAMRQPEYHGSWIVKTCKVTFSALRSVATFPPLDLVFQNAAGMEVRQRTRIALAANNDYQDLFGLIPKRSSLNGGFLTLYVSTHRTRWGMIRSLLRWLVGRWKQDRELLVFQSSKVEINIRGRRRVAVMMDGEIAPVAVPFAIEVVPKALRVLTPAPQTDDTAPES